MAEIVRTYTEEQIQDGLAALALHNGSVTAAARALKVQGWPIPKSTLEGWKRSKADELAEARALVNERIWRRVSDKWRRAAEEGAEATSDAIEAGREAMAQGDAKTASTWGSTAQRFATAGGISHDKSSLVDGRPTQRRDDNLSDLPAMLRELHSLAPDVFPNLPRHPAFESTAEEIEPDEGTEGNA
jgi:hypothetical protein